MFARTQRPQRMADGSGVATGCDRDDANASGVETTLTIGDAEAQAPGETTAQDVDAIEQQLGTEKMTAGNGRLELPCVSPAVKGGCQHGVSPFKRCPHRAGASTLARRGEGCWRGVLCSWHSLDAKN